MLQAKFLRTGKGGSFAVYEVQGTSAELKSYADSITAAGRTTVKYKTDGVDGNPVLNSNGDQIPLFFTAFPMPGKDQWHSLVQIQSGPNKGNYTLDSEELNYSKLLARTMGADLGTAIANQLASQITGVDLSSMAKSNTITLKDDDESPASAGADLSALEEQKGKTK
jgi:hypothetical protein